MNKPMGREKKLNK